MPVKYRFNRLRNRICFACPADALCGEFRASSFELQISDLSGLGDGQIFFDFVLADVGSVHIPFDLFVFYKLIKNMLTQGFFHQC
jgi:hypothetical protein